MKIQERVQQTIDEVGGLLGERRSQDTRESEDVMGQIPFKKGDVAPSGSGVGVERLSTIRTESRHQRRARITEAGVSAADIKADLDDVVDSIANAQVTMREALASADAKLKSLAHRVVSILSQAKSAAMQAAAEAEFAARATEDKLAERRSSDTRGAEDAGIGEIPWKAGKDAEVGQAAGTEKLGRVPFKG